MGCEETLDQDVIGGECSGNRVLDDFDVRKCGEEGVDEGGVEVCEEDWVGDLIMVFEKGYGGDKGKIGAVDDDLWDGGSGG